MITNLAVGVTGLGLPVIGFTLAAQFVQLVSRVPHSKCTVVAVSNINTSPTWVVASMLLKLKRKPSHLDVPCGHPMPANQRAEHQFYCVGELRNPRVWAG